MHHKVFRRLISHLSKTPWTIRKHFSNASLDRIERAIQMSERSHTGQIRFIVESDLHPIDILGKKTPNKRAMELFAQLGIWDTEQNNGVLIYLLLADKDVEIVADRGIHNLVGESGWHSICVEMESHFCKGDFEEGVLFGIKKIGGLMALHFPSDGDHVNELPDKPLVI